ncbi:MAG: hypothetical protein GEU78_07835 [Actinobacteria bacterium]|nr:hypothetical protein [Actinomycetota bacterium]
MLGIPLELLTLLGSGIMGGVMSLWSQSIKARQAEHIMALEALKAKAEAVDQARRYSNPGFQFTRRIIALTAVFAVVLLPKLVAVFMPETSVTVGWTEWSPGFLFFEGSNEVAWKTAKGLVITPLDTHLLGAITGLYFGASIIRNSS